MRLTRLFMLTTALLLTLVTVLLARSILQDWHTVQSARQGVQAMAMAYRAMKVAEKASAERGPAIPVLNNLIPSDTAKRERLTKARGASDAAMAEGLRSLEGSLIVPYQVAAAKLRQAQNELTHARAEVDRVAALPPEVRTAPGSRLTRGPIDLMFGVIDTVLESVTTLSAQAELIYPDLSLPLVGARYSAELREYAGRLGSQFTTPLATHMPLGAAEQREIGLLIGRIGQLRKLIEVRSRSSMSDPRITDAIGEMNRRYFGVGLPFIGELTEAGAAGLPYGIDSAAFIARYVPEMTSIVQLRDSMFQVAREGAQAKANAAERRLSVNAAIGLAILLIEISVFVIIQRRVLKPLLANTRAMVAITEGKLDTELPVGARTDEIGDIQKAVVALRETSRGKRALEIERETLIDQLRVASDVDFLTNLPNRRAFAERTAQQLELARRHGWKIALVLFDIDHFKQVNDLYGHAAGDVVLVRLAAAAQLEFRAADVLARHGGEEFIAMIFDCGADDALALVERVRAAFERIEFQAADGNVYGVTSSFGVTTAHAADVIDTGLLIRVADQALYLAKVGGRNRVVCRAFENVTARDEPATPPRRDSTDSAMHPI